MASDIQLFKAAGLPLANIGKYKAALAKVQASAPVIGGTPLLRLDKEGVWRYGQQLTEVEPGSLWAANPLTFSKGFTAWQKGINKPKGSQLKNILSGELVSANDLPDLSPAVWNESVEVEFQCINGEDKGTSVKYTANSKGGVERWHELVAHLSHQFEVDPNKLVPVVSLEHDGYFSNDASYGTRHPESKKPGWIVKPIFKVVEWMSMDGPGGEKQEDADEEIDVNAALTNRQDQPQIYPAEPAAQPTGRRQSTVQPNGNGAAAPQPTRRGSTITNVPPEEAAQTLAAATPGADPVVRRRRRVAS